jgi:hypothetical protein
MGGETERHEDGDDERFERTLRTLLNTPPRPHKGRKAAEQEKKGGRGEPDRPKGKPSRS